MNPKQILESGEDRPETILIVDDDEINRVILRNIFSPFYSVAEAENGKTGLRMLLDKENSICAVLLDVVMPEMDGIRVLQELHRRGIPRKIPVFMITAEASGDVIREAYDLGVMDVIYKPVTPYIVRRRVNSVVELYRARKRLSSTVQRQHEDLLRQARQIITLNQGMIEALATAIEFRSMESGEHVRRIYSITKILLSETPFGDKIDDETVEKIALSAVMHDVGKLAIPDNILNKPGRLTEEEFEIMKSHTVKGASLLEKIPQMRSHETYKYAADIARHHHERWDGRGYPDGLKGDEISVWTQAVSLADVYDALVNDRVYKKALPHETACKMIVSGECGVFNPKLLNCFLSVCGRIRELYEPEVK